MVPLVVDVFSMVLVCDPYSFQLGQLMTIEQVCTTVAFMQHSIGNKCLIFGSFYSLAVCF